MPQKVVINKCYGGFCISPEAIKVLAEMKSDLIEEIDIDVYYENDKSGLCELEWSYTTNDLGDGYISSNGLINQVKKGKVIYRLKDDICCKKLRTHKDLIAILEEMGSKFISGRHAELAVVEIPNDVEWEIEEYDGVEWISEKHRVWS